MLLLVVALQFAYNFSQTGSVMGQRVNISVQALLDETNAERAKAGQQPLELNQKLSAAANLKAEDMFAGQYWAHTSPSGTEPWQWLHQSEYAYSVAGENLAKSFHTSRSVTSAWMNSPEHRKNMLDSRFEDVGFAIRPGVLDGNDTTLVVALYGAPRASLASTAEQHVLAAQGSTSLAAQFGDALRTMNPSLLATLFFLGTIMIVSLVAHQYRHQLPRDWRTSWRRHHGLYKALVSACLVVVVIALYGGGQI